MTTDRIAVGLSVCAVLVVAGCASVPGGKDDGPRPWDLGPIGARDQTVTGASRLRAAGPLFESRAATNGTSFTALRPFYSSVSDATADRRVRDLLWPVGSVLDRGDERTWRFLVGYGQDFDSKAPDSRYRFWIFPVVFMGRDADNRRYGALFPVWGRLREFLSRDRIDFVLFPAYAHSVIGDLDTKHVLWPIVSWSHAADASRFRVFPLYGRAEKEDRSRRRFVLWPIWTSTVFTDPREPGYAWVLFPLAGRVHTTEQEGWMALPPLIRWSRGPTRTEIRAPWPFVQLSRGDVTRTDIWPLWGHKQDGHFTRTYALWPIIRLETVRRAAGTMRRTMILPFVYSESVIPSAEGNGATMVSRGDDAPAGAGSRYFKLWPLWSYRREGEDRHLRMLDLWPLKHTPAIERNLAPLWSLYTRRDTAVASESDWLWGLYRRQSLVTGERRLGVFPLFSWQRGADGSETSRWSALFGLIARERRGMDARTRILYLLNIGKLPAAESGKVPAPDIPSENDKP